VHPFGSRHAGLEGELPCVDAQQVEQRVDRVLTPTDLMTGQSTGVEPEAAGQRAPWTRNSPLLDVPASRFSTSGSAKVSREPSRDAGTSDTSGAFSSARP
jgi:hypothetical protein